MVIVRCGWSSAPLFVNGDNGVIVGEWLVVKGGLSPPFVMTMSVVNNECDVD